MTGNAKRRGPSSPQHGFGLIEILVALAISGVLLTGVVQIYLGSKLSYRVAEANSRVQEAGRFAVQFITEDLRMAGYSGCFRGDNIDSILNPVASGAFNPFDVSIATEGHDWTGSGWSPALPAMIAGEVLDGTDVVVMRSLSNDGIYKIPPGGSGGGPGTSAQLFVNQAENNVQIGDIIGVTDCDRMSIGQVTNTSTTGFGFNLVHSAAGGFTPGNQSPPQFSNAFAPGAEIARLRSSVYYIAPSATTGEPALFRRSLGNNGAMNAQELVDGVENLQILYGEDTSGNGVANRYVAADEITASEDIVSVRVSLLVRSEDNIASASQTYLYNGEEVLADDLRMRRVFTSTVKLRNRGIL